MISQLVSSQRLGINMSSNVSKKRAAPSTPKPAKALKISHSQEKLEKVRHDANSNPKLF